MTGFISFKSSPDFVGKAELYIIWLTKIDSFNNIFEVPFVKYPWKEDYLKGLVPPISMPIIIGRLAGKVKYPIYNVVYRG